MTDSYQYSMFGIPKLPDDVKGLARKIMLNDFRTRSSDRYLFREVFKECVRDYDSLDTDQCEALEELASKDFIRRAQEIRKKEGWKTTKEVKEDLRGSGSITETMDLDEAIAFVSSP